jgi:hypothetical protein
LTRHLGTFFETLAACPLFSRVFLENGKIQELACDMHDKKQCVSILKKGEHRMRMQRMAAAAGGAL